MLESLTLETFQPLLNETFQIAELEGESILIELTLIEAEAKGQPATPESKQPFSLMFQGPTEPILAQGIYAFQRGAEPPMALFMVPIGPGSEGTEYQVIFS